MYLTSKKETGNTAKNSKQWMLVLCPGNFSLHHKGIENGQTMCWVRFTSQHETSGDSEIIIKEDADHQRKITKERNSEVYWRIQVKLNEARHRRHDLL